MAHLKGEKGGTVGKPAVILLHGLGATRFTWHKIVAVLKDNFRTHALDLWGYGESYPAPAGFEYSLGEQAEAVLAYMEDEGIASAHVVGHSMGGGVALQIAANSETVEKLVLIAAAAEPIAAADLLGLSIGELGAIASPKDLAKMILGRIYDDEENPDIDTYADAYQVNFDGRSDVLMKSGNALGSDGAFPNNLSSFTNPALLVWGTKDEVTAPDIATRLKPKLAESKLVWETCGHAPHEEMPDEVNKLVAEFLKQ